MRIALISGSRSDRNALEMVRRALEATGHDMASFNVEPMAAQPRFTPAEVLERAIFSVRHRLRDWPVDLVIVHGDRHEILAGTMTANLLGYPIAHIGGGDITEGSQDDCFRHAITKLSHLHFVSHEEARDRVVQMGEEPDRVYLTGCPGIDMVMATETLWREETWRAAGLPPDVQRALLVLLHPNTLGDTRPELEALSLAVARRKEAVVLLGPNNDAGASLIREEWKRLAANRPDTVYHDNVEPRLFYSLMKHCDVMVGNSSAAYYEAPCFGIPVVDLGDRQKGRPQAQNIQNCCFELGHERINAFITRQHGRRYPAENLYGDGHAAERIAKIIGDIGDPKELLRKRFHHIHDLVNE